MNTSECQEQITQLESTGQYKVLSRVPEMLQELPAEGGREFKAAFIDLETTGLDPKTDEIIEIGILIAKFTNQDGFTSLIHSDNQLQEPNKPISEEVTKITGITNEDVKGKSIDWTELETHLSSVDLIICHNASFDRNFLEQQTAENFKKLIESKPFGCSQRDISWSALGFEGVKLEYLNLKTGYFYEGHRALVDCWATINLFVQSNDAFKELKESVRKKEYLICATGAPFEKKDELKSRGYRWSDGSKDLPKAWWTMVSDDNYRDELEYLKYYIYNGKDRDLPTNVVTAKNRFSYRAMKLSEQESIQ